MTNRSPFPLPSPLSSHPFRLLLSLNALGLVLAAVWLRAYALENIPGVNGDEAWYGVKAWQILHGEAADWHTPTGNPLNPLLLGPLALLHLWLPPSIILLRSVALAGGLAAIGVNWLCCRWVFGRRTAAISTVILAILPIDIAYSRFAWDASQSLAVTLPALYLALAAGRFPRHFGGLIAASCLALAVAFWVHPTNVFAGAAIPLACVLCRRPAAQRDESRTTREKAPLRQRFGVSIWSTAIFVLASSVLAAWFCTAQWTHGPLPGRVAERLGELGSDLPQFVLLFPRLFTGATIYRYIAGSRSWFEWPLPAELEGCGLDVGLFWLLTLGSAWLVWRSWRGDCRQRIRSQTDGLLLAAWALQCAAFLLVAGPQAMAPGEERFAVCLIGPTVLLLARGASLAWKAAPTRPRVALAAAALTGWLVLADFHAQYFQFIERTGGQSHLTFRTAAVEPKQAALQYILDETEDDAEVWIVCPEWWNRWPIRYLSLPNRNVHVPEPKKLDGANVYRRALAEGRVWFVEFCERQGSRSFDPTATRREFFDYAQRPLLCASRPNPDERILPPAESLQSLFPPPRQPVRAQTPPIAGLQAKIH